MIQYTIEKKTVMTGANLGEIKYYPKIVRATTMTTEKIAALLEERTTIISEAYAFLQAMAKGITFYVKEAFVVEAEGLGVFSPYIQAKAVDTLEEATEKTIKKKGVRYRPTKAMETKLNQIRFQKANLDVEHL